MTIRVLVVDDSATMRGLITLTLQRDPEIRVIGKPGTRWRRVRPSRS